MHEEGSRRKKGGREKVSTYIEREIFNKDAREINWGGGGKTARNRHLVCGS